MVRSTLSRQPQPVALTAALEWRARVVNMAIVPIDDSAKKSAKLSKKSALKIIPGAPHGMCTTLADQINNELLAFVKD